MREKIEILGCPGVWTTNLSDSEIREFHQGICSTIEPRVIPLQYFDKRIEIRVIEPVRIDFGAGACLFSMVQDHYTVIYRTAAEWVEVDRRRDEIKQEEVEQLIEIQLFKVEDDHLMREARNLFSSGEQVRADFLFSERLRLRQILLQGKRRIIYFPPPLEDDAIRLYARFDDISFGLRFLERMEARSMFYHAFATHVAFVCRRDIQIKHRKMKQIYDRAVILFPANGALFKDACLLWRREGRLDLAILYCQRAIDNNLTDDTRGGFPGRLRRLQAEMSRQGGQ